MIFGDIKRIAKNPKILIPIGILFVIALFVERSIEPKNPLPNPSKVISISAADKELDLDKYVQIYQCLENANRLIHGPQGEILANLLIYQENKNPLKFIINEFTIIQIGNGIYECGTSEQSNKLYSLIQNIDR